MTLFLSVRKGESLGYNHPSPLIPPHEPGNSEDRRPKSERNPKSEAKPSGVGGKPDPKLFCRRSALRARVMHTAWVITGKKRGHRLKRENEATGGNFQGKWWRDAARTRRRERRRYEVTPNCCNCFRYPRVSVTRAPLRSTTTYSP